MTSMRFPLCLAAVTLLLAAATPVAAQDSPRAPLIPRVGETVRIDAPTLPAADRRLRGSFLRVDSVAGVLTLSLETREGVRFVPCNLVHGVQLLRVRRVPLWQKVGWTVVGAWAGLYLGHAAADASGGVVTEDPPLPHPDRDRANHRRENRIMIGGALLGAGTAILAVRDASRWRTASLGSCVSE